MANGGTTAWPLRPDRPIGGDELARGLTLVRASALKMARLHVAMERRDRRLVLETMDDLVSLDDEIRDLVDQIPRSDSEIDLLQSELEAQRAALAREKLALVGGVSRREFRRLRAEPSVETPAPTQAELPPDPHISIESSGPGSGHPRSDSWMLESPQESRRDWRTHLVAMMIVLFLFAAVAGAAWLSTADPQSPAGLFLQPLGG